MTKTCLVTGAAGFAAEHLIPKLRNTGWRVLGVDRQLAPSSECDAFISGDLSDMKFCNEMFREQKIDLCIHLAAARADWGVSDEEFHRDNVEVTSNLIKFFRENDINSCVFVSSISVMPQNTNACLDEQAPYAPINTYGETKMKCELALIEFCKENVNFELNILRPAVLYGPSDPVKTGLYRAMDNNIFRLIDSISKNRFAIVGSGQNVKTTAYIKNFVDAIIHLIPDRSNYEVYVVCDENPISTYELVVTVRQYLGKSGVGFRMPLALAKSIAIIFDYASELFSINFPITSARIETFNRPTNFSSRKLLATGFQPKYETKDALRETVNWYLTLKKHHNTRSFFMVKK